MKVLSPPPAYTTYRPTTAVPLQGKSRKAAQIDPQEPPRPSSQSGSAGKLQFKSRVKTGVGNVIDLFHGAGLKATVKRTILSTAILTATGMFLGPLTLLMIPGYIALSLGWDCAYAFTKGIFQPKHSA